MGEIASKFGGDALKLVGGAMEGKNQRAMLRAQTNSNERIARMGIQATKDLDRERFARDRELWKKAMGAYSGFSNAPTLAGKSQMDTPYTQIDTPGLGYNNTDMK